MKKILYVLLLIPVLFLNSCTNLDEIYQKLDKHEERLKKFEQLVSNANSSIDALQSILDAQAKRLGVVDVNPLEDGTGYVLIMSDGSKITLRNGKDGNSPKIGVKEVDGVLYWTLDGELILDSSNNPIPATGKDGEDGITPKIRVSRDGEWEISTDGGVTWKKILDSNGNPVKAKGADATLDISITQTEDSVIIVYEGQTFVISRKTKVAVTGVQIEPKTFTLGVEETVALKATVLPEDAHNPAVTWSSNAEGIATVNSEGLVTAIAVGTATITVTTVDGGFTDECVITVEEEEPNHEKLAIEYVAEYNINPEGTGFVTTHSNSGAGYFSYYEVMDKFAPEKGFSVDGVGYHLPTIEELRGIAPDYNSGQCINFKYASSVENFSEEITIAGETKTYTADYVSPGDDNAYGLRFKGNDEVQRTAWRYESTDNPDSPGEKILRITVRYLGPDKTDVTVQQIADPAWWAENSSHDIVRYFPAAGFLRYKSDDFYTNIGTHGCYWSSTEYRPGDARAMDYTPSGAYTNYYWNSKSYGFSVRLFTNK